MTSIANRTRIGIIFPNENIHAPNHHPASAGPLANTPVAAIKISSCTVLLRFSPISCVVARFSAMIAIPLNSASTAKKKKNPAGGGSQ